MPLRTEFQTVPSQADLDRMERDLRFHPSTVTAPKWLTPDQVSSFNDQGYLSGLEAYDPEAITDIRQYFDDLLHRTLEAGGDSYSISSAHLIYGRVHDILSDPRITRYVQDLLGEDVIGWGSHFFCKMPRDGKAVAWHQDASYWPLTPSKSATVWLAIDDADTENACMRFIAGSHHKGHLTYRNSRPEEHNVLNQTIECPESYGTPVDNILKAGQISIHSDLLLHGSDANHSHRRRCGLTLRYCTPDVRTGSEWNQKGVWVTGKDPSEHWANRPRPDQE